MALPQSVNFRLPEEAYAGLAALIAHSGVLGVLLDCAEKAGPGTGFGKIARNFADEAKIQSSDAGSIVTTLWNLYDVRRELDLSADDMISALTAYLDKNSPEEWRKKYMEGWQKVSPSIQKVLDGDSSLALDHKSVRLTYAHQNVLIDADMITDVRPVFNQSGEAIRGMVVSHQMVIEYHDGFDAKRLHVVIDGKDVSKLSALCKRAETKAQTTKSSLMDRSWITSIAGIEE